MTCAFPLGRGQVPKRMVMSLPLVTSSLYMGLGHGIYASYKHSRRVCCSCGCSTSFRAVDPHHFVRSMAFSMVVFVMMHSELASAMAAHDWSGHDSGKGYGTGSGSGSGGGSDSTSDNDEEELPQRRMPHRSSGSHSSALPLPPPAIEPPLAPQKFFSCPACNRQFASEFPCWQHMAGSANCRERLPDDLQTRIRRWENEPPSMKKRRKKGHNDAPAPWERERGSRDDGGAGASAWERERSRDDGGISASAASTSCMAPPIGAGCSAASTSGMAAPPIVAAPLQLAPPVMAAGGFSTNFMAPPPPLLLPGGLQALPVRPPPPMVAPPTATAGTSSAPSTRPPTPTAGTCSASTTRPQPVTPPHANVRGPPVYSQTEVHVMIVGAVQAAIQGLLASRAMLSPPKSPRRRRPDSDANNLD